MPKALLFQLKNESKSAFLREKFTFNLFGLTFTISHAHDNEYQVLLPDKAEILRLIQRPTGIVIYEV